MAATTVAGRRLAVFAFDAFTRQFAVTADPGAIRKNVIDLAMELLPDCFGGCFSNELSNVPKSNPHQVEYALHVCIH